MVEFLMLSPHARVSGDSLRLSTPRGERRIAAPRPLLRELIAKADGTTPTAEWLGALGERWARADLEPFVEHLIAQAFLVPVEALPASLWQFASNPRRFGAQPGDVQVAQMVAHAARRTIVGHVESAPLRLAPAATALTPVLSTRRSGRRFALGPVAPERMAALLWAGYGACAPEAADTGDSGGSGDMSRLGNAANTRLVRTVPSAGALYPLDLYLLNLRAVDGIEPGAYRATFGADRSVQLEPLAGDVRSVARAFGDPSLIDRAQGIIAIAGDFSLSAKKYGPRALSYVALEAGHVAQNILLQAQALELAAVELGGFIEDALGRAAGITPNRTALTTIVFGLPETGAGAGAGAKHDADFEGGQERVPTAGCTFEWLDFDTDDYALAFSIGQARVGTANEWSWGRDRDAGRAWLKAIMEAHERHACERPRADRPLTTARFDEWPDALAPDTLTQYSAHQYARESFPFAAFDPKASYEWIDGLDVRTGQSVAVTADHVYYPRALHAGRARLTAATSSGAAAHRDRPQALERAVLEVLERDALMRAWLERRPCVEIEGGSLPGDIRVRIDALRRAGVEVRARALDVAPAVGVFVSGRCERKHFTRVASAAGCDAHEALDHALMELEAAVAASFVLAAQRPLAPTDVRVSQDHARLYGERRHFRRADWFIAAASETCDFRTLAAQAATPGAVVDRLLDAGQRIVAVDLRPADASGPHVVRALMPHRVPLTFGYGLDPEGMTQCPKRRGAQPFPHPFT